MEPWDQFLSDLLSGKIIDYRTMYPWHRGSISDRDLLIEFYKWLDWKGMIDL